MTMTINNEHKKLNLGLNGFLFSNYYIDLLN